MSVLQFLPLAGVFVGLFFAVLGVPRWCFRSLARHRLWELRDRLVDDVLDRRLDADDEQVVALRERIENAIGHVTKMTAIEMLMFSRLYDRSGLAVPDRTRSKDPLLRQHEDRFRFLLTSPLILGSWIGVLATTMSFLFVRGRSGTPLGAKKAAVETAGQTRLGRYTIRAALQATNCTWP